MKLTSDTTLKEIVKALETEERWEPLTLGEFIEELRKYPSDKKVYLDRWHMVPTSLDSYRGDYAQLALGFNLDGQITVSALLNDCEKAVGKTFGGYKGGDFVMTSCTPVWVDNWGEYSRTGIVGIRNEEWCLEIVTKRFDD